MPRELKPQILVVDDEPDIRQCLEVLLTSAGYDVATADNGVSAVLHLRQSMPDLILTDLNMPQMSGMELLSHVSRRYPAIPTVAMSGEYLGEAVPAGLIADRFYPKGVHPHNLLTTIASLLATNPTRAGDRNSGPRPAQPS